MRVKFVVVDDHDGNSPLIDKLRGHKIVSSVFMDGYTIIGRHGTNKRTLRKILKAWLGVGCEEE